MKFSTQISALAAELDHAGFPSESKAVLGNLQSALKKSEGTDYSAYVINPAHYPATTASDEVAALLNEGAQLVNNYHGANNYVANILPHFIERLDWLSRKYRDNITDQDRASLGKLERDLHTIIKTINKQSPM